MTPLSIREFENIPLTPSPRRSFPPWEVNPPQRTRVPPADSALQVGLLDAGWGPFAPRAIRPSASPLKYSSLPPFFYVAEMRFPARRLDAVHYPLLDFFTSPDRFFPVESLSLRIVKA